MTQTRTTKVAAAVAAVRLLTEAGQYLLGNNTQYPLVLVETEEVEMVVMEVLVDLQVFPSLIQIQTEHQEPQEQILLLLVRQQQTILKI